LDLKLRTFDEVLNYLLKLEDKKWNLHLFMINYILNGLLH
jgi:hypothetical protein